MKLPSVAAITDYGQIKQNYSNVEDPSTDEDAADRNNYVEDVAGMTHTAIRAVVKFSASSSVSSSPTSHEAVWGSTTAVKPTIARTGTGVYTITWPSSVSDALTNSHTLSLRYAFSSYDQSGQGSFQWFVQAVVTSANVVTVRVYASNIANDPSPGMPITVFVL